MQLGSIDLDFKINRHLTGKRSACRELKKLLFNGPSWDELRRVRHIFLSVSAVITADHSG